MSSNAVRAALAVFLLGVLGVWLIKPIGDPCPDVGRLPAGSQSSSAPSFAPPLTRTCTYTTTDGTEAHKRYVPIIDWLILAVVAGVVGAGVGLVGPATQTEPRAPRAKRAPRAERAPGAKRAPRAERAPRVKRAPRPRREPRPARAPKPARAKRAPRVAVPRARSAPEPAAPETAEERAAARERERQARAKRRERG